MNFDADNKMKKKGDAKLEIKKLCKLLEGLAGSGGNVSINIQIAIDGNNFNYVERCDIVGGGCECDYVVIK